MVNQQTDWRLTDQAKYLKGVTLTHQTWHPQNPKDDHDHCAFCWAKSGLPSLGDGVLQAGWTTSDRT